MALFGKKENVQKSAIGVDTQVKAREGKRVTLRQICDAMEIPVPGKFETIKNNATNNLVVSAKRVSEGAYYFVLRDDVNLKNEINRAVGQGAKVIFVDKKGFEREGLSENDYPVILLDKKIKQVGAVYSKIRDGYSAKAIAIAGMRGKTTTKRLIRKVLGDTYSLLVSGDNATTYMSVGNHIMNLTDDVELFIQELGATAPVAMKKSARMLRPDVCVLLNSRDYRKPDTESINRKKYFEALVNLDTFSSPVAVDIVNNDDDEIAAYAFRRKVISFGVDAKNAVDYRAINIVQNGEFLEFDIVEEDAELTHMKINGVGRQMVYNTLAAFAVGRYYHIKGVKISRRLTDYRSTDLTGYFRKIGGKYIYLDDDEVNEFTMQDIRTLADEILQGQEHSVFVVIGDTGENDSAPYYNQLKENAAQNDLEQVIFLDGTEDAVDNAECFLSQSMKDGDLLVFRGTKHSNISVLIDRLFNTSVSLNWGQYTSEDRIEDEDSEGRLIPGLHKAEVTSVKHYDEEVYIPETIGQVPVYKTGRHLFKDNETIREIQIGTTLRNIGVGSFYNCSALVTVTIPGNVCIIESGAFRNCKNLTEVVLEEGVQHIEKNAFKGCEALEVVYIPSSVLNIEDNAFAGCEHVEFHCAAGSFAQEYAKKNGIEVQLTL